MIALDTNILVYAHRGEAPFHAAAAKCVRDLAEGRRAWAIPWPCVHEFLSIVTHPRIFRPPTTVARALDQVDAWTESPSLVMLGEPPAYLDVLRTVIERSKITGPAVHDARIAAIAIAHGVDELWTADRDFSRFPALNVLNPLTAA